MSDPEIARRCLRCGATVRERAQFCFQCGQPMQKEGVSAEAAEVKTESERAVKETKDEHKPRAKRSVAVSEETKRRTEERVARVRERSMVVLDEAAVDPSLRFVLVAFLLFAIFVVVLLLSLFLA